MIYKLQLLIYLWAFLLGSHNIPTWKVFQLVFHIPMFSNLFSCQMYGKVPCSCQVEAAWENFWIAPIQRDHHGKYRGVKQELKVELVASKGVVSHNREEPWTGHQE
jgi:hypothetical protein